MRRISFEVDDADVDTVLDAVLALLPCGVRQHAAGPGRSRLTAVGPDAALPGRKRLEEAAGRPLEAFTDERVPADWRRRRESAARVIAGRVGVRSPVDPPAEGLVDVVIPWRGVGFGSGSHPTTRMALQLIVGLSETAQGWDDHSLTDVGCGVGTLAIAAAKLGFEPVAAVDADPGAVEAACQAVELNAAPVDVALRDVVAAGVPPAAVLAVNAPPAVHAAVVDGLDRRTRAVVVSGVAQVEAEPVLDAYAGAGLTVAERLVDDDGVWLAALLVAEGGDG